MADVLSPEVRALIDAAVNAGMVEHVERGVSAFDPAGKRSRPEHIAAMKTKWWKAGVKERRRKSSVRRAQILELLLAGKSASETAEIMGLTDSTIWEHARELRKEGLIPTKEPHRATVFRRKKKTQ